MPDPGYLKFPLRHKIFLITAGIFLSIILIELSLQVAGGALYFLGNSARRISAKHAGEYRIICIGESTTVGGPDAYPAQLETILNQRSLGFKFRVLNAGVTGIGTTGLVHLLEDNIKRFNPDMIIAMMGINDFGFDMHVSYPALEKKSFIYHLKFVKLLRLLEARIRTKFITSGFSDRIQGFFPIFYKEEREDPSIQKEENELKRSITRTPHGPLAHIALGELYLRYIARKTYLLRSNMEVGWVRVRRISFSEVEHLFENIAQLDPENAEGIKRLSSFLEIKHKAALSEEMFRKALELDPENSLAYGRLGESFVLQDKFQEAEEAFKNAIKLDPDNIDAYCALGIYHLRRNAISEAESALERAVQLDPRSIDGNINLGRCYMRSNREDRAQELFKNALTADPACIDAFMELAVCYFKNKEFGKAEENLKRAAQLDPSNKEALVKLAWCYMEQDRPEMAEGTLNKLLAIDSKCDRLYGQLASLYAKTKDPQAARGHFLRANNLRLEYFNPTTYYSFQRLKQISDKHGIKLVCVQYPMRSADPLKRIFKNNKDIIFVDNENNFKEAVGKAGYEDYFTDVFGGDFGHCTQKGNRLLAENIAQAVVREYYRSKGI